MGIIYGKLESGGQRIHFKLLTFKIKGLCSNIFTYKLEISNLINNFIPSEIITAVTEKGVVEAVASRGGSGGTEGNRWRWGLALPLPLLSDSSTRSSRNHPP